MELNIQQLIEKLQEMQTKYPYCLSVEVCDSNTGSVYSVDDIVYDTSTATLPDAIVIKLSNII